MITTDIDFPADLPCGLRDGYVLNPVQPFVRTDMKSGRSRQRRAFTSVPTMVNVSWLFRHDGQAAAFEAWFRDAIDDGAQWFNAPLRTPVGMQNYICRFTEMYKGPSLIGANLWRVDCTLEIFERPLLPVDWGEYPDYAIHADIFDLAMNREWPAS